MPATDARKQKKARWIPAGEPILANFSGCLLTKGVNSVLQDGKAQPDCFPAGEAAR
ncbi:hypothetical protein AL497_25955 [Klebsiella aerogenes]|nr:hypothetical protein AL497_25955 [Klebsiella aerogenes]AUZ16984.1 hypothetical protein AL511_26450 [Klebsiella aerogenes]AVF00726.1 hypothetical protein AM441_19700 [Klebsiella aerogenes]AWD05115.1 hypothetical protein AM407_19770 [Klebsiella aerogenes]AXY30435.1 hypothetical protein CEQ05_19990 [Klebsiella aerogenes]